MGKIRIPFLPTKEVRKIKDLHFNIATYKIEGNDDDNHGNYNLKLAIFSHYSSKSKIFLSEFPIFQVLNSNRMLAYLHIQIESKLRPPTPPPRKKENDKDASLRQEKLTRSSHPIALSIPISISKQQIKKTVHYSTAAFFSKKDNDQAN